MKYYIASPNGSGIETDTLDNLILYLKDMAEHAAIQGDEYFDIFVTNMLTDEENHSAKSDFSMSQI